MSVSSLCVKLIVITILVFSFFTILLSRKCVFYWNTTYSKPQKKSFSIKMYSFYSLTLDKHCGIDYTVLANLSGVHSTPWEQLNYVNFCSALIDIDFMFFQIFTIWKLCFSLCISVFNITLSLSWSTKTLAYLVPQSSCHHFQEMSLTQLLLIMVAFFVLTILTHLKFSIMTGTFKFL